jgi:hypothetical protein
MEFFALLPSIFSAIVAIALLYSAEKDDEYIGKIWCFILGLVFVWVTIFLVKLGMGYVNDDKKVEKKQQTEYYSDDLYIY